MSFADVRAVVEEFLAQAQQVGSAMEAVRIRAEQTRTLLTGQLRGTSDADALQVIAGWRAVEEAAGEALAEVAAAAQQAQAHLTAAGATGGAGQIQAPAVYHDRARDLADALGFDPYAGSGPLGKHFAPGVHDCARSSAQHRERHERDAAQILGREGADVRLGWEDHSRHGQQSIDAYVRWNPQDPGTGTELKSIIKAKDPRSRIQRDTLDGGKQLRNQCGTTGGLANGHVVIDGSADRRDIDGARRTVIESDAMRAFGGAVGVANKYGQTLPTRVTVVLGDGSICVFRPREVLRSDGGRTYARPDSDTCRRVMRHDRNWAQEWRTR